MNSINVLDLGPGASGPTGQSIAHAAETRRKDADRPARLGSR
jgi:hypothetical protein